MTNEEIKLVLEGLPRSRGGRIQRIPSALREAILREARRDGDAKVGAALGISPTTIYGWRKVKTLAGKPKKFREITISEKLVEPSFSIEGPRGLRFVGLTVSDAAALLREVSREF
jgi:transposase-like protein